MKEFQAYEINELVENYESPEHISGGERLYLADEADQIISILTEAIEQAIDGTRHKFFCEDINTTLKNAIKEKNRLMEGE